MLRTNCTASKSNMVFCTGVRLFLAIDGRCRRRQSIWKASRSTWWLACQGRRPGSPPRQGVLSSTSTLSINLAPARRLPPTNHNLRPSALSTLQDFFHLLSCGMFLPRRSPRLIQPGETGALERSLTCITTMRTGLVAACSTPKCFRETVLAVLSLHWYHTIGQIDLIFSGWSSPLLSHPEVDLGNGSYPSA